MTDFGPHPNDEGIQKVVLALCRMTHWGLNETLGLSYGEAIWWLEGANQMEEEISSER